MVTSRRAFLIGSLGLIAAPAIVRAESLMKIVAPKPAFTAAELDAILNQASMDQFMYGSAFLYGKPHQLPVLIDPMEVFRGLHDDKPLEEIPMKRPDETEIIRWDSGLNARTKLPIIAADWNYRVTKAPPGGFKIIA